MLKGMSTTSKIGLGTIVVGAIVTVIGFFTGSNNTDSTANASNEPAAAAAMPAAPAAPATPAAE